MTGNNVPWRFIYFKERNMTWNTSFFQLSGGVWFVVELVENC